MADIDDGMRIDLVSEEADFFRNLPRGLRSSKIFNVI
jgi:hypothetical protein